jgi:hypothetical protein
VFGWLQKKTTCVKAAPPGHAPSPVRNKLEIIPSYLRNVLLVELSHYLATNQRDNHQVRFY